MSDTFIKDIHDDNREINPLFFMAMADSVKCLSNCRGSKFGCVITDGSTIFIGYNGNNFDKGSCVCERCDRRKEGKIKSGEELDLCKCQHAEQMAIDNYMDIWMDKQIYENPHQLFVQSLPCWECALLIKDLPLTVNIYDDYYAKDDDRTIKIKELFIANDIKVNYINASDVANYKWKCNYG